MDFDLSLDSTMASSVSSKQKESSAIEITLPYFVFCLKYKI